MDRFPKLKGPPPLAAALGALGAASAALFFVPDAVAFLALNAALLAAVLAQVIGGRHVLRRSDSNILLASVVVALIALYGAYRIHGELDRLLIHAFLLAPAGLFYLARRLVAYRYAVKAGLGAGDHLGLEAKLELAAACRTAFRKELGALTVAALLFREVAEDGLAPGAFVRPVHIKAMQNYAHMLLYGEARGIRGEGEWYARKAKQMARAMLRGPGRRQTIH